MTDYHHTKFGLIWSKESKVKEGSGIRPPQVVLNRPGEIGLNDDQLSSNFIIWFILLILNHIRKIKIMSLIKAHIICTFAVLPQNLVFKQRLE